MVAGKGIDGSVVALCPQFFGCIGLRWCRHYMEQCAGQLISGRVYALCKADISPASLLKLDAETEVH